MDLVLIYFIKIWRWMCGVDAGFVKIRHWIRRDLAKDSTRFGTVFVGIWHGVRRDVFVKIWHWICRYLALGSSRSGTVFVEIWHCMVLPESGTEFAGICRSHISSPIADTVGTRCGT